MVNHRSELDDVKYSAMPANTLLHEEDRPAGAELDGESNQAKQRRPGDQHRDGHCEIQEALPRTG
jgi:hypothetical protein